MFHPLSRESAPFRRQPLATRELGDFSFESTFSYGWETFKSNYLRLLGGGLLYLVVLFGVSMIEQFITARDPLAGVIATILSNLFVAIPLGAGIVYMPVRIVRGNSAGIADLFAPYRRLFHVIAVAIVVALITIIAILPFLGVIFLVTFGTGMGQGGMGVVLLIAVIIVAVIVGIMIGIRLGFSTIILLDEQGPQPGVFESIATSWRITAGTRVWPTLFIIGVCCGLIIIACGILLILPAIFFAMPLVMAVWGSAYVLIAANYGGWFLRPDVCPSCGYSIQGLDAPVCPECGTSLA